MGVGHLKSDDMKFLSHFRFPIADCRLILLFTLLLPLLALPVLAADRQMKEFNFPLFRSSITNSTIYATAAQRANGSVEVLPNSILIVGGQIRGTNGTGTDGMQLFLSGSINGGDWVTNVYTITNTAAGSSITNSWTAIVGTNIPYKFISLSGMTTARATAVLIPYVSGLWVPWERP